MNSFVVKKFYFEIEQNEEITNFKYIFRKFRITYFRNQPIICILCKSSLRKEPKSEKKVIGTFLPLSWDNSLSWYNSFNEENCENRILFGL